MNNWKEFQNAYRESLAASNLADARRYLKLAIERVDSPDQVSLPGMYNQLANISLRMNDGASAEEAARKAIETETRFGPPVIESDHMAAHYITLAVALKSLGRLVAALQALDQGIVLYSQHLSGDDGLMTNLKELRNSFESEAWRESDR